MEGNLGKAVLGTVAAVAAVDAYRAKQRIEKEAHQEYLRRQQVEKERREYRAALTSDLRDMAVRWRESKTIREFLAVAMDRVPESERSEGFAVWLAWARQQAAFLDPLHEPKAIAKPLEPECEPSAS